MQLFADLLPVLKNKLPIFFLSTVRLSCSFVCSVCLGLLQENLCFKFTRSEKNLQDMKHPDASLDNRLSWVFT